jgi:hypothetical protein
MKSINLEEKIQINRDASAAIMDEEKQWIAPTEGAFSYLNTNFHETTFRCSFRIKLLKPFLGEKL